MSETRDEGLPAAVAPAPNRRGSKPRTTSHFIERATKVHGDRYDYERSVYAGVREPIEIGCAEHGYFFQTPDIHYTGSGCQQCGEQRIRDAATSRDRRILPTSHFIERATKAHGDRYGYDRVVYDGASVPVEIKCAGHGYFSQTPSTLYAGRGCPPCGKEKHRESLTIDFDELIRRATKIHAGRYSYPAQNYRGMLAPITVTCSVHGDFSATLNNHIYSESGCPKCKNADHSKKRRSTKDAFVTKAKLIHGDAYDYTKVEYLTTETDVTIICPAHGEFSQRPSLHVRGGGCVNCGREGRRLLKSEFVRRSNEFWNDRFDYSLIVSEWTLTRSEVPVICAQHGQFMSRVYDHLRGRGCMRCTDSQPERQINELLTAAGVDYVAQWTHPTLRSKRKLRVDFAIPSQMVLIEYDGVFHFRPVRWGTKTDEDALREFHARQARDRIKDDWAEANGWRLLRLADQRSIRRDLIRELIIPDATTVASQVVAPAD